MKIKRVKILIRQPPYAIPAILEIEEDTPEPNQSHRWENPPYWLVLGPKGRQWCRAPGRTVAMRIYRHIPWTGDENGLLLDVALPAREDLAEATVFWIKESGEPSRPCRMVCGKLTEAPDGYSHIEQPDPATEMALA